MEYRTVIAVMLALLFALTGCGGQADVPPGPARAPAESPSTVVAEPRPVAPKVTPTMGTLSAPSDTAVVPSGEYLTWGKEPVEPASSTRSTICLNGLWQFVPNADPDKLVQPEGGWGWMRVPGSWRNAGWPGAFYGVVAIGSAPSWKGFTKNNQVSAGWYQRPIRIPGAWAGKRVVLDLARVSTDATVFLDGQPAGQVGWPTGQVELSTLIKPGTEQSLRVLVLSTAGVKEFAQFMGTATEQVTKTKAETNARGLIGDVTLTALTQGPTISEVFVKPTVVPRTRMDLEVTLTGVRSAGPATVVATLTGRDGAVVKSYEATVSLSASDSQVVQAGWDVDGVQVWDLGKPNLYQVEVAVRGGGVQDSASERFGFRQIRIDGRKLYLNGSEIRLRTALPDGSMHTEIQVRESIAQAREFGYNFYELWPNSIQRRGEEDYQEVVSRIADEEGFLISGIMPHMADSISGAGFDRAAYAKQLAAFRRMRNHPAVIMWGSSGNYFGHNTDQDPRNIGRRGFADRDAEYLKRAKLGNEGIALIKAMDPTRPTFTHHGGDVGDVHTCNNYLNLMPLQEREEWLSQWSQDGTMPFWPVEFETPMNLSLNRDRNNHFNSDTSEPLMSEYCASYQGEEAHRSERAEYRKAMAAGYEGKGRWRFRSVNMDSEPAFQALQVENQRAIWRSWRALGSTTLPLPWNNAMSWRNGERSEVPAPAFVPGQRGPWQSVIRKQERIAQPAWAALAQSSPDGAGGPTLAYIANAPGADPVDLVAKDHHAVAGAEVRKTALLINDEREAKEWTATWRVQSEGKTIAEGSRKGRLAPAEQTSVPITFTTPAVTVRSEVAIVLDATIGGRVHRDAFAVQVYPAAPRASGTLLALDPAGATTRALQELGFTVTAWDGKPAAGRVVVVGRHALAKPEARARDLAAHVAAGGRLIVMTQERNWYEQDQGLRTSAWSSRIVFPVSSMAAHPVLAGLQDADLRDWNGAGSGVPAKPVPLYEKESHGYPRHGWKWGNSGTVAGLAIEKPHHGAWRPLLQCEFDLAFSPLMELPSGPGLVLWCTLDLEERSRPDPVASLILRRLVEHAAAYTGETPRREAAVLGDATVVASLGLIGAPAKTLPTDLRPIVLASDAAVSDADLGAWLDRGGRALVLVDATRTRLGFTTGLAEKHLGSLAVPGWPEARGLAASDLRLRNEATVSVLQSAPQGGELGANGLLGRLAVGQGVAILTTIDPGSLPAAEKPWFHYSQWRWTRALAQLAGNVGIAARGDGKALLSDLGRDAPRRLAGSWLMQVERPLAPADKPWQDTPRFDAGLATADTANWFPIPVPGAWESSVSQFDGAIWVRKHVEIPADWAGQKLVLDLGPIDDHDQVWFQGVKIGGMGKENPDSWQTARSYGVKPELVKAGPAVIAIRVFDWFGGGGFSAKTAAEMRLRRSDKQGTPIVLGGAWQARIERAVPPAKSPGELVDSGIDAAAATWHEPATDDRNWQAIVLPRLFEDAFADIDGSVWLRRTIAVPQHWLGRDLELSLGRIGNDDVAYVGGVEVGRSSGAGNRVYPVPAALVKSATLAIAVRVFNRQGPGGFLGWNDDLGLALPGDIAGAAWYEHGYRTDFSTGDDPFRYYRW